MEPVQLSAAGRRIIADSVSEHPGVHASSVAWSATGELAVAWFDGPREGAPGTQIRVARGDSWDDLTCETVSGPRAEAQWNPVVHWEGEDLTVYFQVGPSPSTWRTCKAHRTASGWARHYCVDETGHVRGPVRNHLLEHDGALFAGASVEDRHPWMSAVDVSGPRADVWTREVIPGNGTADLIQPALVRHQGQMLAFMRSSKGLAYLSTRDSGGSWSEAQPTDLPNNNSGLDVVDLEGDLLLAVANESTENWGPRCPLLLYASVDGRAWTPQVVVDDGSWFTGDDRLPDPLVARQFDGALSGVGEYSYPSITVLGEHVLVSYTWQRRAIALARFLYH